MRRLPSNARKKKRPRPNCKQRKTHSVHVVLSGICLSEGLNRFVLSRLVQNLLNEEDLLDLTLQAANRHGENVKLPKKLQRLEARLCLP